MVKRVSEIICTGGGRFDPKERNAYFIASGPQRLLYALGIHRYLLVAVNELASDSDITMIESWLDEDKSLCLFLDSGVYNLATEYAKERGVSMDIALSTNPEDMSGFESLFERYVSVVRRLEKKLWCYIEIDQGGRDNKIKTRTRLEKLGLRPTPVYHPLNDGWEYFDFLAERYDRICFGNVVNANAPTRERLVATTWERHRKYPDLWIHMLGLTPNQWLNAFPINSGDSSSWLTDIRWWKSSRVHCDGQSFSTFEEGYRYRLAKEGGDAAGSDGSLHAIEVCGYKALMDMLCWRTHLKGLTELGVEVYPSITQEIKRANE